MHPSLVNESQKWLNSRAKLWPAPRVLQGPGVLRSRRALQDRDRPFTKKPGFLRRAPCARSSADVVDEFREQRPEAGFPRAAENRVSDVVSTTMDTSLSFALQPLPRPSSETQF